ncbi:MAG: GAK system ATP-grasp enzyme [Desulfobacteraceae bacterium]|jgi:ribosomal protein S6--L-glutamate ligase
MIKVGVVGTPGGWSTEALADAINDITGFRFLIDNEKISANLTDRRIMFDGVNLMDLDGIIIKKMGAYYSPHLLDRLEILRFVNESGAQVFSAPEKIIRVLSRVTCTVTLQSAGIPMPDTTITEDIAEAVNMVERYGEAVFKPVFSTKARGMELIKAGDRVYERIEAFKAENRIMYLQKRIDHRGEDLGITFLGGKYLTTYARCSDGSSWNTTTRSGGKYKAYEPSSEIMSIAEKAQALFGLDFTCVDVAETEDGPKVFEVSAFGGFKGISAATGIDAARQYSEYVLRELKK